MKKYRTRLILLSVIVIIAAVIFMFSAQNGEKSGFSSEQFTKNFLRFFGMEDGNFSKAEHLLRKIAHFAEYFLLGTVICIFITTFQKGYVFTGLVSLGVSFVYAAIDELHQYFVPDRSSSLFDVLLDGAGALCGILLVLLVFFLFFPRRLGRRN